MTFLHHYGDTPSKGGGGCFTWIKLDSFLIDPSITAVLITFRTMRLRRLREPHKIKQLLPPLPIGADASRNETSRVIGYEIENYLF